jgi:hypothetical protein
MEATRERIQHRAYELFVQRGNVDGSHMDDWLKAESEIMSVQSEQPIKTGSKIAASKRTTARVFERKGRCH